jgi:hypothetical protein
MPLSGGMNGNQSNGGDGTMTHEDIRDALHHLFLKRHPKQRQRISDCAWLVRELIDSDDGPLFVELLQKWIHFKRTP